MAQSHVGGCAQRMATRHHGAMVNLTLGAELLREEYDRAGFRSHPEFAAMLAERGVKTHTSTISRWFSGERSPSPATIEKLAHALGWSEEQRTEALHQAREELDRRKRHGRPPRDETTAAFSGVQPTPAQELELGAVFTRAALDEYLGLKEWLVKQLPRRGWVLSEIPDDLEPQHRPDVSARDQSGRDLVALAHPGPLAAERVGLVAGDLALRARKVGAPGALLLVALTAAPSERVRAAAAGPGLALASLDAGPDSLPPAGDPPA